ncbi:hypothetical protein TSOC_013392, partial [Tetrabaena socialis]
GGKTPLELAEIRGKPEVAALLQGPGHWPLHLAAARGGGGGKGAGVSVGGSGGPNVQQRWLELRLGG